MKITLHILQKDLRRLWLPIAVTLVILGVLANAERWRSDAVVGATEGWLNFLLPLAWAFLAALAINEEPPVGDCEFWTTRPYRRANLLASKLILLVIAVHVPLFVADCAVLAARGFGPLSWLPQLFIRQLLVACWLTLPAIALAAMVNRLAQFLVAALAVLAGAIFVAGAMDRVYAPWLPSDTLRQHITVAPIAAAAIVIVVLQYARRRTLVSRIIAVSAAAAASLLYAYTPPAYTARAGCRTGEMTLRVASEVAEVPQQLKNTWPPDNGVFVAIPLSAAGFDGNGIVRTDQLALELIAATGEHYRTTAASRYGRPEPATSRASLFPLVGKPAYQLLWVQRSVYDRLRNGRIRIVGRAVASFYRSEQATWMRPGENRPVAGLGRCYSVISEELLYESGLKVVCESPGDVPLYTHVRVWYPANGTEWKGRLGDSWTNTRTPQNHWLSPLNRMQTWFQTTAETDLREGMKWRIPREWLSDVRIEILPEFKTGCAGFHYELPNVSLSDHAVPPPRR